MSTGSQTSPPRRRSGLFAKYVGGLIAVVTLVLVVNGAIDIWFSYRSTRTALERIQQEKAASAAQRVEQFVAEIERQVGWTTHAQWAGGPVDQRRFDFIRLLRQVPAITELVQVDGLGREQLKVSRLAMDVVGSDADWSSDPRFKEIQDKKVWFSPVYLRKESEPYMSVSLARVGRRSGATVAEVNLKLIWDVVNAIKVGKTGYAYVVDRDGKLIAHPDISLVLRATDMSRLRHVHTTVAAEAKRQDEEAARRAAALEAARQRGGETEVRRLIEEEARGAAAQLRSIESLPTGIGTNLADKDALYAVASIPALGWLVFVELPMQEALQPLYTSLIQTGLLLLLGLALAAGAAWLLARRMMVPIRALGAGADRLGSGDLAHRIEVKSGDEIETLAGGFNRMAEQLQESYAGLEQKVEARTQELARSVEELTASGEILRLIAGSPDDLQPMFQTILEHATRLCEAHFGYIWMAEGDLTRVVAMRNVPPALAAFLEQGPIRPGPDTVYSRTIRSRAPVQLEDVRADPTYAAGDPMRRASIELGGIRTLLGIPMIRQGEVIGVFGIFRQEVRAFSDKQVNLLATFADQAVIAIENSRLLRELRSRTQELGRSVEELTASGEILRLIASTPDDLQPMFDTVMEHATRLCEASFCTLWMYEGDMARAVAVRGAPPAYEAHLMKGPIRPPDHTALAQVRIKRAPIQQEDVRATPEYGAGDPVRRAGVDLGGIRTLLSVPLIRQGEAIGVLAVYRREVQLFTEKQIKLVATFADQAVIAIENSRLLGELRSRTQELGRSVEELTASGEILRIIAGSPDDLEPMFRSILEHGTRLCEASFGVLRMVEGDVARPVAMYNIPPALAAYLEQQVQLGPDTTIGRAMRSLAPAQTEDARTSAAYLAGDPMRRALVDLGGMRSVLSVPMIRQGELIGALSIFRQEVSTFSDKQVNLMSTFADQAVIAIENSRLLRELRSRTQELGESLEYQTATSDVLKVISSSAFNLMPVLQTVAETAASLCHADEAAIFLRHGDAYRWAASIHINSAYINAVRDLPFLPGRDSLIGRTALEGEVVQIEDALADPEYGRKDLAQLGGVRTLLGVPLVRDGTMAGVMVLTRRHVEAFTDKQVEVLQVFADQAVIAVENVRLITEIQEKSHQLELASQHKSQFLANMSHELRTPLNAVLGYAELLLDGIYGDLPDKALGVLERVQSNGKHLLGLINDVLDLSKIEAGQLKLSLDAYALSGVVQTVVAATESLANAKGLKLKATIGEGLPTGIGDERRLAQVLLNLVGNAIKFTDRGSVEIAARAQDGNFDIAVTDTGTGIAPEDQARIFEEFQQVDNTSTRKKGGTGLGLAISRRIVALHGGALTVESEPGHGSTFRVILPVKVEQQREAA